ncbi:hydroxyacylglutathione hydrolase [Cypionkella aquatica]|uniref:Hydroxyacylglutathione hydrolase n=1 Tax=Cypionkella aquatica TaxID=1756042 RepID=A0AA37TZQ2_9RHOB|nr:FAD-dependent oxidoreductase [Cypionkella aquatica]GLS88260.1 hydroxyacylglutathione hydrolase [Cypionkella aquatica]
MTKHHTKTPLTVAIIGGGLSGAAVAYHLAHLTDADITVIEPRADLGRGMAYATPDPDHRLNVPDHKMTLRSDRPEDFRAWLHSPDAPTLPANSARLSGEIYAPRAVFGAYVAAQLQPLLQEGRLRHLQSKVVSVARASMGQGGRYTLGLSDSGTLRADIIVLATTHPSAGLPRELANLADDPSLIADPFAEGALASVNPDARVLIVGNGLTSADIVASLHRRGHRGKITALSRHGLRSQPHGPAQPETKADFAAHPPRTALDLLRRARAAVAQDQAMGLTWHAVFDRLRAQGPAIWAALPEPERRRFLRHLRALWDVHRFRIAPQTYEANQQMQRLGRLVSLAARIVTATPGSPIKLGLQTRHNGTRLTIAVDRVILATGPAHGSVIKSTPALADLAALGLLQPDPLGLGLLTAASGQAVPGSGSADGSLLVAGPLARATVGELMGVPEVITWAEHIAREVAGQINARRGLVAAQ